MLAGGSACVCQRVWCERLRACRTHTHTHLLSGGLADFVESLHDNGHRSQEHNDEDGEERLQRNAHHQPANGEDHT